MGYSGGGLSGGGMGALGLLRFFSMFGWKGMLVGLVLAVVLGSGTCLGGSGLSMCGGSPDTTTESGRTTGTNQRAQSSSPQEDELVHFVGFVFDDVQKMWAGQLQGYQKAKLVLFRRGVNSACGTATTAVGPFYCQIDNKVYIDLTFYDELRSRFGAPGDFAQAYVIAHEVGHHVQKLTNNIGARGNKEQIAVELQADCLAGAWGRDAERRGILEVGDVDEALNAASQIGDDTLQRKSQGYVQPESWTHGSAAQRRGAFDKGYQGGATACGL